MEMKLYDTVQAARFLGVSRERVSQLCRDGLLESKSYGRARLISEPDLIAFSQKERKAGRPKKEGAAEDGQAEAKGQTSKGKRWKGEQLTLPEVSSKKSPAVKAKAMKKGAKKK
jgi:Helix-turn-helix domain